MKDLIVLGGGAAGIFAAITFKENFPHLNAIVIEKHNALLAKVRISGGGRCNVTHACFDPNRLVTHYPRGHKELIGPFHQFQPQNTVDWFEAKGVKLKTEIDGRIFPVTDSSATIIECLLNNAQKLDIEILTKEKIETLIKTPSAFELSSKSGKKWISKHLIIATGSSREGFDWAQKLGHSIHEPIPSLFTFNIPDFPLQHLSGISWENVELKILGRSFVQKGPLLITHFGLSGPAVLKLSAWEARFLHHLNYKATVQVNWLCEQSEEKTYTLLQKIKFNDPQKLLLTLNPFNFPKKLWKSFLSEMGTHKLCTLSHKWLRKLTHKLHKDLYLIDGKTINKEEFVTCGGVKLSEIDFKTMQSKKCPGLFFAGEILDIDGITGGFNFQNAWTTGYIAGKNACL